MRQRPSRGALSAARVAAIGTAALLFTSCASAPAELASAFLDCPLPLGPVVVAAAPRSNSAAPAVTPSVQAAVQHAIDTEAFLAVLDTDGAPTEKLSADLPARAKNAQARKDEVSTYQAEFTTQLDKPAQNPEADLLAAMDMAARTVRAKASSGTVVLVDSGVQTVGALMYQSGDLLLASGDDVVAHLRSQNQLPELTGLTVIFSGLGDTAGPQQRLDTATRSRLIDQWTAIARAGAATCVEVDDYPLSQSPPDGLPAVATVKLPAHSQPKIELDRPVALREDAVSFRDNSAELRDPGQALANIKSLAAQVLDSGMQVTLIGTTATAGTEDGRRELSKRRAEAVEQLLIRAGVPSDRITTKGVGIQHPSHVDDLDQQGNLIPAKAMLNRAVYLSVQ